METRVVLQGRRSIRSYLSKPVEWWKIAEILDAARFAPSAGNLQNWSFIVIENQEKKKDVAEASLKQYWMVESTLIVVCSRMDLINQYYGTRGEMLYSIQDCASAIQNMLLRAFDLGLGSCWIGAFDEDMVKRSLKIPAEIRVQAILTIGYSDEKVEMPSRHNLQELCYFEIWGGMKDDSVWPLAKHKAKISEKTKKQLFPFLKLKKKE